MECPRTFYRFTEDPTIAHLLHIVHKFLIANNYRLPVGASIFEIPSVVSIAPYQYRTAHGLRAQEMDCPQHICAMESHVNFYVPCLEWNSSSP